MKRIPWNRHLDTADPLIRPLADVIILAGPDFDHAEVGAVISPMQAANDITNKPLFSWRILRPSIDDTLPVNAVGVERLKDIGQVHRDTLIVIAGHDAMRPGDKESIGWVRRQFRAGSRFVLVGNAQISMARAGLLDGRAIAVHWEKIQLFQEVYPSVRAVDQLYTLDPVFSASSCSDATIELFVSLIDLQCGSALVRCVRARLNRPHCRSLDSPQSIPISQRYGTRDQTFLEIVQTIEDANGEGLCVNGLCQKFGMSRRNLERKFSTYTATTPCNFIRDCQLRKAVQLLHQSDMQDVDIAVACGFPSLATFRALFKRKYGLTPSQFTQSSGEVTHATCVS